MSISASDKELQTVRFKGQTGGEQITVTAEEDRRIVGYEVSYIGLPGADTAWSQEWNLWMGSLNLPAQDDALDRGDQLLERGNLVYVNDTTNGVGLVDAHQDAAFANDEDTGFEWNEDASLNFKKADVQGAADDPSVVCTVYYYEV